MWRKTATKRGCSVTLRSLVDAPDKVLAFCQQDEVLSAELSQVGKHRILRYARLAMLDALEDLPSSQKNIAAIRELKKRLTNMLDESTWMGKL